MELLFDIVFTVAFTLLISYLISKLFSFSIDRDHDRQHHLRKRRFLDSQVKQKTKQSRKKTVFVSKIEESDGANESNIGSGSPEGENCDLKGRSIGGDVENLIDESRVKVEVLSKGESEDLDAIKGVNKEEKGLIKGDKNCENFDNVSDERKVFESIKKELGICSSDYYNSVKELNLIREEKVTNKIEETEGLDCVMNSEDKLTDSLYSVIVEWERKLNNDEVGIVIKSEEIKNLECEESGVNSKKEMDLVSEEEVIVKSEEIKNLEWEENLVDSMEEMDLVSEEQSLGRSEEIKKLESEENRMDSKEKIDFVSEEEGVGKSEEIKNLGHEEGCANSKEEMDLGSNSEKIKNLESEENCMNSKEEGIGKSEEIKNLEREENCMNSKEEMDLVSEEEGMAIEGIEYEVNLENAEANELLLEDEDWEGIERSELELKFGAAVAYVDSEIHGNKMLKLDDGSKLLLYGLHKVALEGPCRISKPSMFQLSARAKWNSWQKLGNMSPEIAMEQYINLLTKIVPGWLKADPSDDGLLNEADDAEVHRKLAHESTSSLTNKKDNVSERKHEDLMHNVEELNLHFTA